MLIKLNGIQSAELAMERASLDWSVEQAPLMTQTGLDVSSHKALYRGDTNKVLGVVGSDYSIIQNTTAFAFFDIIAQKYGATYEYAGIIKEGKRIFIQAQLHQSFQAAPGDTVESFITLVTAHDGSSSLRAFLTPIRLFCQNQLIRAIKSATTNVSLKHTANVNDRIRAAMDVFQMSAHAFQVFEEKSKYLARKVVDRQMVAKFLSEVIVDTGSTRAKNQQAKIADLFVHGRGNRGKNVWELYNAAVEFVDHERSSNEEKSLDSAMFGSGAALKEKAFEVAMAL